MMREISATDAAKRFSDLLDAVEHRGESFVVVRRGQVIASLSPAPPATEATLRSILAEHPPDPEWAEEARELRRFSGPARDTGPWND